MARKITSSPWKRGFKNLIFLLSLSQLLLFYQSCGNLSSEHVDNPVVVDVESELTQMMQYNAEKARTVLNQHCAGCHQPINFQGPPEDILDFTALEADGFIVMGEPQSSDLYLYLVDGHVPLEGPGAISPFEIENIRQWLLGENALTDDIGGVLEPEESP